MGNDIEYHIIHVAFVKQNRRGSNTHKLLLPGLGRSLDVHFFAMHRLCDAIADRNTDNKSEQ